MNIKEQLADESLNDFCASNGWLEKWKQIYGIRNRVISGEASDVPVETVDAWLERIQELVRGYAPKDIWNMDETGVFFQALPNRGLADVRKKAKGGKRSKKG